MKGVPSSEPVEAVGGRVVDRRGEMLGTIEDLVVDVEHATVAYAVVLAGDLFAVPWAALRHDGEAFVLDADREHFESAPSFARERWPRMADAAWASRLHEHYGVRPYWSEAVES
jgi:sporulation protein YlmC with PRC-barrel domain